MNVGAGLSWNVLRARREAAALTLLFEARSTRETNETIDGYQRLAGHDLRGCGWACTSRRSGQRSAAFVCRAALTTVVSASDIAAIAKGPRFGPNRSRVDLLKSGNYIRVWIKVTEPIPCQPEHDRGGQGIEARLYVDDDLVMSQRLETRNLGRAVVPESIEI